MSTTKDTNIKAYCWQSGQIGFTNKRQPQAPAGTIVFASGPRRIVKDQVTMMARIAYDGKTLLVPGLPECRENGKHWITGKDPVQILSEWGRWVRSGIKKSMASRRPTPYAQAA